jgi:diaminopimelate decarboxylase
MADPGRGNPETAIVARTVAGFFRENNELTCDGVRSRKIARARDSSTSTARRRSGELRAVDRAFAPVPHLVCYAAKANSNLAILKLLARSARGRTSSRAAS